MGENVHHVTDLAKLKELKYKKKPIIAQFYTEWCPPCKPTRTALDKELKEIHQKVLLACVNCDEAQELNIEYEIQGVPTIILFNNDQDMTVLEKMVGYDAKKIKQFMEVVKKQIYKY